ncbi:MAG: tetratricopeptide repeat protein [Promethearchaeota archaeon]
MKTCPFCNTPIESHWSYCRNCNKPLITNLDDSLRKDLKLTYDGQEVQHLDLEENGENFDSIIINDKEIEQRINEIDETLERKEVLGEAIPGGLILEKSSLYYKKRDLSNALKNLELAIKNFEKEKDLLNIAICHNEIGIIQEDYGFFDQAIYHFNRSLEILRELKDNHKIIKILNNLGNVYFIIKDLEQSYSYYEKALQLSKQENFVFEKIKSSSNLVEVLFLLKDYGRIKEILRENAEFFKENGDIYGIIQTEIKYGKLYYLMGENYQESFQYLMNALNLINSLKEKISIYIRAKLEWECQFLLGKIYHFQNNHTSAENLFLQSLESIRIFEIGDSIKEGEILENLAELYISKGDIERAIEFYELTSEIFYKFGDNNKNAELKFKLGKIYLEFEEDQLQAINLFEEALTIYEDLRSIKECALIFHKLGDIYLQRGMIDSAMLNFENARKNFQELQDDYNVKLLDEKIESLKYQNNNYML